MEEYRRRVDALSHAVGSCLDQRARQVLRTGTCCKVMKAAMRNGFVLGTLLVKSRGRQETDLFRKSSGEGSGREITRPWDRGQRPRIPATRRVAVDCKMLCRFPHAKGLKASQNGEIRTIQFYRGVVGTSPCFPYTEYLRVPLVFSMGQLTNLAEPLWLNWLARACDQPAMLHGVCDPAPGVHGRTVGLLAEPERSLQFPP